MCTISLFGASKKTADDWAAEIETVTGPIDWKFKENLTKGKEFKGETIYSVDVATDGLCITIKNPMVDFDNLQYIIGLNKTDIGSSRGKTKFEGLNKGDIFITYEGEDTNTSHLWVMKAKKVLKSTIKLTDNGGLSLTDTTGTAMKYRGWSAGDYKSAAAKGAYQGETEWNNGVGYYTISYPSKGEFSIMLIDTVTKNLTEYQLYYLGSSKKVSFIQKIFDAKYKK